MVSPAMAAGSGGYNAQVVDPKAESMGFAFAGEADTPSAVYYNPAGLTQLNEGRHIQLGATALQLRQHYHSSAAGQEDSAGKVKEFTIPHFFFADKMKNDRVAFGFGVVSTWGLGTEWADNSFAKYKAIKTDMVDSTAIAAIGVKVTERFSLGAGFDFEMSRINKTVKFDNLAGGNGNIEAKGKDNDGMGYHISGLFKINDQNQIGLVYRSPIQLDMHGKLYLDNLGGYAGMALFGGKTNYETEISSKMKLPQSVTLGYSFRPTEKWRINADVEWMNWSSVRQSAINYVDPNDYSNGLLSNIGASTSLHFKDTISGGIGTEYWVTDRWAMRMGYAYFPSPVNKTNYPLWLADSNSSCVTVGTGIKLTNNLSFDLAYVTRIFQPRKITDTDANIAGTYKTFAQFGMGSLTWDF
ncbi:MAG: outer membrane protein transport protein [Candidatus Omnitrophica bacterium]|nr:outer membrane protein transport protein [Candidatus Omnitrophota bacterium]